MATVAEVIVFAGPTLPTDGFPDREDISWRAPVKRGDVLAALVEKPTTLVLIDGYYYQVAAVTHKEILYALDAGVRVIGAASMGALRAAELHGYGMEGVGRVFELYRDGVLDGDDEVAVMHGPAETGYVATTLALVVVREAMDELVAHGHATSTHAARVIDTLKSLPFQDRTQAAVEARVADTIGPAAWEMLSIQIATRNIKTRDAKMAVIRSGVSQPAPATRSRRMGCYLAADLAHHVRPLASRARLLDAFQVTQVLHPEAPAFVRSVRRRHLTQSVAKALGIEAKSARIRAWTVDLTTRDRAAGHLMPDPELRAEAEVLALIEAVGDAVGNSDAVASEVARRLGLDLDTPEETLLQLVAATDLPLWELIRPFAFTRLLGPAMAVASSAGEVRAHYLKWSDGARPEKANLWPLAAEIWRCGESDVPAVASDRGLFEADARNSGLREALELVAPAERLPRPINDYPEDRRRLVTERLRFAPREAPDPIPPPLSSRPPGPEEDPCLASRN